MCKFFDEDTLKKIIELGCPKKQGLTAEYRRFVTKIIFFSVKLRVLRGCFLFVEQLSICRHFCMQNCQNYELFEGKLRFFYYFCRRKRQKFVLMIKKSKFILIFNILS